MSGNGEPYAEDCTVRVPMASDSSSNSVALVAVLGGSNELEMELFGGSCSLSSPGICDECSTTVHAH